MTAPQWGLEVHDHKTAYLGPIIGREDDYDGGGDIVDRVLEQGRRDVGTETLDRVVDAVNILTTLERLRAKGWEITVQIGYGRQWSVILWGKGRTISHARDRMAEAVAAAAVDAS